MCNTRLSGLAAQTHTAWEPHHESSPPAWGRCLTRSRLRFFSGAYAQACDQNSKAPALGATETFD